MLLMLMSLLGLGAMGAAAGSGGNKSVSTQPPVVDTSTEIDEAVDPVDNVDNDDDMHDDDPADDDTGHGSAGDDTLDGGTGHDDPMDGHDDMDHEDPADDHTGHGSAGDDTLDGGTGHDDPMDGHDDMDHEDPADDHTGHGSAGDDTLDGGTGHDDPMDGHDDMDHEDPADDHTGHGSAGDDTLDGGTGHDDPMDGHDDMDHEDPADDHTGHGSAGDDTLDGGTGHDDPMDGHDDMDHEDPADDHTGHGSAGDDTLDGGTGHDDPMDGHDDMDHEDPADDHTGHGSAGDDTLDGGTGHDDPMDGHDDMDHEDPADDHTGHGSAGDDTLDGGTGHDDPMDGHDDMDHEDPADDHTGHGSAGDDTLDSGTGHDDHVDDHGDMGHEDGHMDHGGHSDGFAAITAPQTQAEIDTFVAAVRAAPDVHNHNDSASKASEHMAAMDLVPRDEATHIAIGHGDWDDPANWYNGEVPGDDARVLIPEGIHMTYDHINEARLFTLRVDGKLEYSTETSSQMIVDTLVISPSGYLEIGTEEDPVASNVNVDIIFANNGAIDTDWDPTLLSRGMIAHGNVEVHGTAKDSHDKVVDDPMAGDTWVDMGEIPEGWAVGDTIVIAGTQYQGYIDQWNASAGYVPPEDEIRVITEIEDGMIFFDDPLVHDHDAPREDLKTSVANYTRNVSFETEDADLAEVHERGHVMFMHNDDVDVRYAEFHELGRTDKSELALNASEFDSVDFDTNVKGRYAFHFHRAGLDDQDDPGISIGNAVYGSPGWGFVHHDSNAIFDNNATYDTFGAGYVAESGNETGAWTDNIAIFAQGRSWRDVKNGSDPANFDNGVTGDGFFFQSRMVDSIDNVAASVNHGFAYFHRGPIGENGQIVFDPETSDLPDIFHSDWGDTIAPDDHPILSFSGNETFASRAGLFVSKADTLQGHDVHTVLQDFTAWEVSVGAGLEYTSRYLLKDFDIVGRDVLPGSGNTSAGIHLGTNAFDITIVDAEIEKFKVGFDLHKKFTLNRPEELHDYTIINPTLSSVGQEYNNFDPALDTILSTEDLPNFTPDLELTRTAVYTPGEQFFISARKHDTLGEDGYMKGEGFSLRDHNVVDLLNEKGYYTTPDDESYFMTDLFFSDRVTGDIYMERHPIFLDESVPLGQEARFTAFDGIPYNGEQDLSGSDDPTIDSAILWATLTDGQFALSDDAVDLIEEDAAKSWLDSVL